MAAQEAPVQQAGSDAENQDPAAEGTLRQLFKEQQAIATHR